jgi:hypothetical protein
MNTGSYVHCKLQMAEPLVSGQHFSIVDISLVPDKGIEPYFQIFPLQTVDINSVCLTGKNYMGNTEATI